MRRSPNPWPIGLREPNPAGVRETRAVAGMVGHSEEVGSGYANACGGRYLVISVALVRYGPVSEYAVARPERALTARRIISKPLATRVDLALDKAFVIMDRQRPYAGKVAPLAAECYCESLFSTRRIAGRGPCVEPAILRVEKSDSQ